MTSGVGAYTNLIPKEELLMNIETRVNLYKRKSSEIKCFVKREEFAYG